ncbi:MAG: hypothetical protein E6H86_01460 [Chloroflexi bacterium]|nr:MAG: hypothetical protein E6H86_01460 [Chloroflexota bacterium]
MGGDLGEGPVAPQVEVEHLALVLRQKRPVALVQGQRPAAGLESVKCHALTAYQVLESTLGGSGARLRVVGPPLIEAFRYHKWANLHLLDVCARLSDDQLQLTTPGTYGTIAATLQHLLGGEQRYLRRMVGHEPQIHEKDKFPGVGALRLIAERSGNQLIEAAGRISPDDVIDTQYGDRQFRLHLGVVLLQALHHGNDHRTHICTILGAHGLEYGDMDVWAYGEATGGMVPLGAS